jgi:membrane protein YdbS with pleckstrin-like domain
MRVKLLPGEQVIARTRSTPRSLFWPSAGALAVLAGGGYALGWLSSAALAPPALQWQPVFVPAAALAAVLLLARMFVRPLFRWLSNRYILTNRRIIHRRGMTRRSEYEVPLAAVQQVGTTQSLTQRLLGSGTLTLDLGHGRSVAYRDVPRIAVFKDFVAEALRDLPPLAVFDGAPMMGRPDPRAAAPGLRQEWQPRAGSTGFDQSRFGQDQPGRHFRGEAV